MANTDPKDRIKQDILEDNWTPKESLAVWARIKSPSDARRIAQTGAWILFGWSALLFIGDLILLLKTSCDALTGGLVLLYSALMFCLAAWAGVVIITASGVKAFINANPWGFLIAMSAVYLIRSLRAVYALRRFESKGNSETGNS
jgi:hypothetical protein